MTKYDRTGLGASGDFSTFPSPRTDAPYVRPPGSPGRSTNNSFEATLEETSPRIGDGAFYTYKHVIEDPQETRRITSALALVRERLEEGCEEVIVYHDNRMAITIDSYKEIEDGS